jgi:hypothetical protein
VPNPRVIERSARFTALNDGSSLGIVEVRRLGGKSTRTKMALVAERAVVAAIAASGDLGRTLHFFVKVSPAPERLSTPGSEAVLTAVLVWGYSPSLQCISGTRFGH